MVDFKKFSELCEPLMEYLEANHNPYCQIIVNVDGAKIIQDIAFVPKQEQEASL